jgi:hypothetical protein
LDQAEHHAEELRHLGEARNDAFWKHAGLSVSGHACCYPGKFLDARAYYENALLLWNPMYRAVSAAPEDGYVVIQSLLSRTLLCLGYVDQARLRRNEALAEARRLSPFRFVSSLVRRLGN